MISLQELFGLRGRTALVTGSSRGIGAAIAHGLSGAGARVIIHAQTETAAAPVAQAISQAGGEAFSLGCDLSTPGAGSALARDTERLSGGLDILIINASAQTNQTL